MHRHIVIANPAAGNGVARKRIPLMRAALDACGILYDLAVTDGPGHASTLARDARARGYGVVVAAGGDGTCNEIVSGLLADDGSAAEAHGSRGARFAVPAFGVLCVGRGNDFAFGNGIPHDLAAACAVLRDDRRRAIDIGRVRFGETGPLRFFCNGLGIGFDAIVALKASRMHRLGGFLGYALGALGTIAEFPDAPLLSIRFDGTEVRQPTPQVSIMNGRRMGGAFYMAPMARSDDGLFDLSVADKVGRGTMLSLFSRFLKGTQAESPHIRFMRGRHFEIETVSGSLTVHADGEHLYAGSGRMSVECLPGALSIVV
jgi:diacylglycerol kinase (ATP)